MPSCLFGHGFQMAIARFLGCIRASGLWLSYAALQNLPSGNLEEDKVHISCLFRHNEDGSYTYGYESSDGSFKLETRYPDGLVQGKYGYIDIDTGELKVIEYGADMMGFQPQGDFPEGIIIPEPVFNNLTDDQGRYSVLS